MLMSRRLPAEAARCYLQAHELLGDASPAGKRARELARRASAAPAPEDVLGCLTLREREVAQLAGGGWRSKEIAEQLRVSRRTVEAHLGRAYHKLGVTSRAELALLVAQAQ
jgi:DNA-binding NarL/FixJ family response regulator